MEQNIEELANLEALNSGMIVPMAQGMVQFSAELFRYYAGWCTKIYGLTTEIGAAPSQFHAYTLREPVGVCGFITPWNVPISLMCLKMAPALAAGCTAVIKPAEETPLTALRLGELLHEAGVPAGVVNIVTGFGHTAGAALAANENVAKIAFTGSTEVGKLIVQAPLAISRRSRSSSAANHPSSCSRTATWNERSPVWRVACSRMPRTALVGRGRACSLSARRSTRWYRGWPAPQNH